MVWNHRIALILLECMMLSCSYGCMRNQRKSQIYGKNIAIKKVTDNMKNKKINRVTVQQIENTRRTYQQISGIAQKPQKITLHGTWFVTEGTSKSVRENIAYKIEDVETIDNFFKESK